MAEMVCTVVIGEVVNRATSFLLGKNNEIRETMSEEDIERLEMAHIKLEAALEASRRWNITDPSVLRWRGMLKRAAAECDDALRTCRRRASDVEEMEQEVLMRNSSFPRRIAHATKSYVSSLASYCAIKKDGEPIRSSMISTAAAVRRFERFADGAGEFMRYVELGGAPRQYTFFDPLIRHLLSGKELNYEVTRGSRCHFFGVRPVCFEERGVEAKLCYDYQDHKAPETSFRLGAMLRLSESTDVVGVVLACLQLVTPHFRPTAETAMRELTQLPTQDFSSKPFAVSRDAAHLSYHSILTEWFRPNPRCCGAAIHTDGASRGRGSNLFPEPVIEVFLQRNMLVHEYDERRSTDEKNGGDGLALKERPLLKLWALFTPHATHSDDQGLGEGATVEVINGQKKRTSDHVGVSWQQMDELLLPKAIEHLRANTEAINYQLFCKSGHGNLQFFVEKMRTQVQSRARSRGRAMRRGGGRRNVMALEQQQQQKAGRWRERKQVAVDLLRSWAAFAPEKLQGPIMTWIHGADNTPSNRKCKGLYSDPYFVAME